MKAQIKSIQRS